MAPSSSRLGPLDFPVQMVLGSLLCPYLDSGLTAERPVSAGRNTCPVLTTLGGGCHCHHVTEEETKVTSPAQGDTNSSELGFDLRQSLQNQRS